MPLKHLVLARLLEGPAHGYELHRTPLQPLHADFGVTEAHIYAALRSLEKDRLVRHRTSRKGRFPARMRYTLTPAGRRYLDDWLAGSADESPGSKFGVALWDPLSAKLFAMARLPMARRVRKVSHHLTEAAARIKEYERTIKGIATGGKGARLRILLSYGLMFEKGRLSWLRGLGRGRATQWRAGRNRRSNGG